MSSYHTSPMAAQATGKAEVVPQHKGNFMGGERIPAFLALAKSTGGVYAEGFESVAAGLRETHLDFEVRMEEIQGFAKQQVLNDDGTDLIEVSTPLALPNHRATVAYPRDGRPPFAICPTSAKYAPMQVADALSLGDNVIDQGGLLVALGAYGKPVGARVYAAFKLPQGLLIGGKDPHDLYLTITTSFDRSTSTTVQVAPIRFACTNQAPGILGRYAPGFRMNHTQGAQARVAAVREALGITFAGAHEYQVEAEKLLKVKMTENKAIAYWRQVFGVDAEVGKWSPRQAAAAQPREDKLVEILGSPTCEFGKGTAYAAMQAVTEYVDFFAPVRGGNQVLRATRNVAGTNEGVKVRAQELALAAR